MLTLACTGAVKYLVVSGWALYDGGFCSRGQPAGRFVRIPSLIQRLRTQQNERSMTQTSAAVPILWPRLRPLQNPVDLGFHPATVLTQLLLGRSGFMCSLPFSRPMFAPFDPVKPGILTS